MQPYLSDENEGPHPWEGTLSPRARRIGLRLILVGFAVTVIIWGGSALWSQLGFVSGTATLDGLPLPNARVSLWRQTLVNKGGTWVGPHGERMVSDPGYHFDTYETTADAQGRYRLSFLKPGRYEVTITYVGVEGPDRPIRRPWLPIDVAPGFQTCDLPLPDKP
jgi:hypothetical protein